MAKPFEIPWTLNDENEFSLPVLPWYFTRQEIGVAVIGTMTCYLMMAPILGMGIVNLGAMCVSGVAIMQWITKYKKGRPSSWLWDLRLALGVLPEQRGLIKSMRKVRWLSSQHIPQPSVFIASARRSGEDLTVSAPWMRHLPPLVTMPLIIPPRRRRSWSTNAVPAPIWFTGAMGFEKVINPSIPIGYVWVEQPEPGDEQSAVRGSP